jgi:hypothetical protein
LTYTWITGLLISILLLLTLKVIPEILLDMFWKAIGILFHKFENKWISGIETEPMSMEIQHGSNVEVMGSVVDGIVIGRTRFLEAGVVQKLPTHPSRVPDRTLVDCNLVIDETVGNCKLSSLVFWTS